jgi:hypothetical protein
MQKSDDYDGMHIGEHHCFELQTVLTIPELYCTEFLTKVKTEVSIMLCVL